MHIHLCEMCSQAALAQLQHFLLSTIVTVPVLLICTDVCPFVHDSAVVQRWTDLLFSEREAQSTLQLPEWREDKPGYVWPLLKDTPTFLHLDKSAKLTDVAPWCSGRLVFFQSKNARNDKAQRGNFMFSGLLQSPACT